MGTGAVSTETAKPAEKAAAARPVWPFKTSSDTMPDCFAILDPVTYGSTLAQATTEAETRDSNFAAMYWPCV